jgi:mono/diheme cytochrome c family protein
MKLYAVNCAVCHGAADGKSTDIAHGLYQKPPQLASDGVEDDPAGVTYWKVYHGMRLTGMPSFAATLKETQIWQVTAFLQNMDHLPPAVNAQWRAVRVGEAIAPAALQAKPRKDSGP